MNFNDLFKSRKNIQVTVIIIFLLLVAGGIWQYGNFIGSKMPNTNDDSISYDDYIIQNDLLPSEADIGLANESIEDSSVKEQPIKEVSSSTDNGVKELEKKDKTANTEKTANNQASSSQASTISKEVNMDAMVIPVFGSVSSSYADSTLVYSKTLDQWATHNGLDIKAEEGSQVRAAMDGVVKEVNNDMQWGMTIIIDHGSGIVTKYSNLSTLDLVSVGQNVKKGDVISGIGRTALIEIAEEPHLHFEVIMDGKNINPEKYLPKQSLRN